MKIMLFSDTFPPEINGVATATNTLKKAFEAHGHDVYVVCTNPFVHATTFENNILRLPGIEIKRLYGYRLTGFLHSKAAKIIKKINPDIIHIQTEYGVGIFGKIMASRLKIPLVYTYHTMYTDYTYYVTKGKLDQPAKSIVKKFSKIMADTCSEITTPSFKTKDHLRSYGVNRYINVIPNGIDLSRFEEEYIDKEFISTFKKKYNLEDKFIILSLGRIAKEKSIDVVLKNYAKFIAQDHHNKSSFVIVGDGPAKQDLEKLAKDLGIAERCIFVGSVPYDEVPNYYYMADLFVSASISETQGLTFIEAIATKTLVMCRFDENLVEVVEEGKTGYFFSDTSSFCNKLRFIMNLDEDTKKQIIETAYIRNKKYSMEAFYDKMLEVYNRANRRYW